MTSRQLFNEFGLKPDTIDFVGHGMALQSNDDYLDKAAFPVVKAIREYAESVLRYGNSPYIYPMYGLGDMPQGFARLSAIYGGTYMLNRKFEGLVLDENGHVTGVKSEGEIAKCKFVIGDPSYFQDRVKKQIVLYVQFAFVPLQSQIQTMLNQLNLFFRKRNSKEKMISTLEWFLLLTMLPQKENTFVL